MLKWTWVIIFGLSFFSKGQKNLLLNPMYNNEKLVLEKRYVDENNWIEISSFRFYLSDLKCYRNGIEWSDPVKNHLIDADNPISLEILDVPNDIDSVSFLIGVDSLTNVSGILEGDLDPIKGMYWTWNSGYINFKLEGKSSLSGSADKKFEYHLGGYLPPFACTKQVTVPVLVINSMNYINFDIANFLKHVDISSNSSIMIPGNEAKELSELLPTLFEMSNYEK